MIRWDRVKLASQVNAPHNILLKLGPTGWNLMVQSCLVTLHFRLTVWIEAWCMYATCSAVKWTVHTWEKMVEDSHQTKRDRSGKHWSKSGLLKPWGPPFIEISIKIDTIRQGPITIRWAMTIQDRKIAAIQFFNTFFGDLFLWGPWDQDH